MKNYSNKIVIESLRLPMMTNFDDLVRELRLSGKLVYWLTKSDAKGKYKTFFIKKRDGTSREINSPCVSLKIVQRWVLENILYRIKASQYSYGFSKENPKGSPLVYCAKKHKNNLYILKLDLKNFYPSIKREKVYYTFSNIGYNSIVSNLLTNICVFNGKLPQGAVTSPYLANLICRHLDLRIAGYCNKRDIVYTRYADDLAFSCDDRELLRKIYCMIKKIVEDEGFSLNEKKTIFMTPKNHKSVLGVTVNDELLKAPKQIKRQIRAMIHYQVVTGDYSMNDQIRGYIAYVDSIENNYKDKCISYLKKLSESNLCLFSDVVEAYNSNKIYKELPDMKNGIITDFVDFNDADDFSDMIYHEHEDYLISHGLQS
jgi:retron-type reverse transcriptase